MSVARRQQAANRAACRGSVLLLFPAAVLVVLVLVAIALEHASMGFQQRDLFHVADAAANDAATEALDLDELRATGALVIDPVRAEETVRRSLAARGAPEDTTVSVHVDASGGVHVALAREVSFAFTALPGRRSIVLRADATARPVRTP
jgi:hypothetical protein